MFNEPSLLLRIHPYSTAAIDYKRGKVFGVCLSSERMKNNVGMNSISKSLIQILRDWWKISRLNCCPSCFQFKVQNLVPIIRFVILVLIFKLTFVFFHWLSKCKIIFLTIYNAKASKKENEKVNSYYYYYFNHLSNLVSSSNPFLLSTQTWPNFYFQSSWMVFFQVQESTYYFFEYPPP